jgi:CheY-like chemotaxis protein
MDASQELREQVQEALAHLHDPSYQPPPVLYELLGCEPGSGPLSVQSAIIQEIRSLQSHPDVPQCTPTARVYDVLHHRYVLRLTQEETAEILNLSVRHLGRVQRQAVHTFARLLWERACTHSPPVRGLAEEPETPAHVRASADSEAQEWRSQTKRELASLQAITPSAECDVAKTISDVLAIQSVICAARAVHLQVAFVQPDLAAAIHPSVLRQILITALGRLTRYTPGGRIIIHAGLEDGNVKITLAGAFTSGNRPAERDLVGDLLDVEDVSVDVHIAADHAFLWIRVPSVSGKVVVLAVDDNSDMAHLYRRATAGTRYRIVHITKAQGAFEAIQATAPSIIVLDVMLPDADGWELLMQLHEHPTTRSIPVIICTVVREEDLALSLGAALYLAKPVRPRQLIQALDQVLSQGPAVTSIPPGSSAAAG